MQVKMVGIGKCGVRIAYDLFAYTKELSSSYEIRVNTGETGVARKLRLIHAQISGFFAGAHGIYRIAQEPTYIAIDSDSRNNEIVNSVAFKDHGKSDEKKQYVFGAQHFDLNNHKGGCNFHVVSESIARGWENIPNQIVDSMNINIYVTSFSIGGGTGGGSAPIICAESKRSRTQDHLCHYMGLGILPKSDEPFLDTDMLLTMADYEKFSTGRFFASLYGNRIGNAMDSVWLFSNDILRFVADRADEATLKTRRGKTELNLSYVNFFVAKSLSVLANSSSALTISDSNLDSKELSDFLNGRPFVSAFSQRDGEESGASLNHDVLQVKKLLSGAISNPKEGPRGLEGLSVPVPEQDLVQLKRLLDDSSSDYEDFNSAMSDYKAKEGPIEFMTADRLLLLYGQPETNYSEIRKETIKKACETIFPNSQKAHFCFRHKSTTQTLLLLLVDPFIQPVLSSIYYYTNNAWGKRDENYTDHFDNIIAEASFSEQSLRKLFTDKEQFPENPYGGGVRSIMRRIDQNGKIVVGEDHIVSAFRHLHRMFHRKRASTNTRTSLRYR